MPSPLRRFRPLLAALLLGAGSLLPACVYAPPVGYEQEEEYVQERKELLVRLMRMLPLQEQREPEAWEEARWLCNTAFKASGAIARLNDPRFTCWMNNRLVNSPRNTKERGLCWQYQHDMYRELRRRKLNFFRLGCCVRDQGDGSEHHCVYLCPVQAAWPQVIVLDAWRYNGRLHCLSQKKFESGDWLDEPNTCHYLAAIYPEEHDKPLEHWARVKDDNKLRSYLESSSPEGKASRQGRLMQANMERGLRERNGKLTPY